MKFSDVLGEAKREMAQGKATDLLKKDHDKVRELFARYRNLMNEDTGSEEKRDLFLEIDREITVHAQVEEEILYPAARRVNEDSRRHVLEANEEHTIVKDLLARLRRMDADDETFDAKMKVVIDAVEHHAEEEENELFPEVEEIGERSLERMGKQIATRKQEILAEGPKALRGGRTRTASRTRGRAASRVGSTGTRSTSRSSRGTARKRTTARRSTSRKTASKAPAKRASAGRSRGRRRTPSGSSSRSRR